MSRSLRSNSSSQPPQPPPQLPQPTQQVQPPQSPPSSQIKHEQQPQSQQCKMVKLTGTELQISPIKKRPFNRKLFNSQQWDLIQGDRTFRDQDLNTAFKYIEQSKTTVLKLDYNKLPTIIKSISNTSFPNLTDLYLGDNTIYSIQLLSMVHMPNLLKLHLNDNPITELKSLRKCYVPNLNMLSIRDIRILSTNYLVAFVELDCTNLSSVMLNYRDQNLCDRSWAYLKKTNWNYRGKRLIPK